MDQAASRYYSDIHQVIEKTHDTTIPILNYCLFVIHATVKAKARRLSVEE